jgi:tRNA threonylcarbamoyladenosine biosynthesis protein TsaE
VITSPVRLLTSGPDQTRDVGAAIAELLRPGDVVALSGELGAGKTCLVQGAAGRLGVQERVTSPTFVLVRLYDEARPPVVHCDVYRLDTLRDVYDLGDEVLAPDVVTFVEWADAVTPMLPDDRLEIDLRRADVDGDPVDDPDEPHPLYLDAEVAASDGDRAIAVTPRGGWQRRTPALLRSLSPWRVGVA